MESVEVVVVGGGMAGLSCAVALKVKCCLGSSSAGITSGARMEVMAFMNIFPTKFGRVLCQKRVIEYNMMKPGMVLN